MERIITGAIADVPGTVAIEAKLAGLAGRAFPRIMAQMDPEAQVVAVDATIAVVWPSPVTQVAEEVRDSIGEAIAAFTGFRTTRVNVTVAGSIPGGRVTAAAVSSRRAAQAAPVPAVKPRPLRPTRVASHGEVASVSAPAPAPVRSVSAAVTEAPLRPVSLAATAWDGNTRPVTLAVQRPLRSITVPAPVTPRSVQAPPPVQAWAPSLCATATSSAPLRPITVHPSGDVTRRVEVPRPQPLRAITITPFTGGDHV